MDNKNLVTCTIISFDCVRNDPVEFEAGGPEYSGFDFYVPVDESKIINRLVKNTLKSLDIPLERSYTTGEFPLREQDVHTPEEIVKIIKGQAEFLRSEATKGYAKKRGKRRH